MGEVQKQQQEALKQQEIQREQELYAQEERDRIQHMQKQQANHTTSTVQAYSETQQAQNSCKMQTGQMGNTATSFLIDQEELQKRQHEVHKRQQDLQRQQEILKHQGIRNENTE